jgi:hypothetical protein
MELVIEPCPLARLNAIGGLPLGGTHGSPTAQKGPGVVPNAEALVKEIARRHRSQGGKGRRRKNTMQQSCRMRFEVDQIEVRTP